jgi:hypothetical protein
MDTTYTFTVVDPANMPKTRNTSYNVGPYTLIRDDQQKVIGRGRTKRTFRVVLYGMYNANGLFGSECNGIAILDEDKRQVLLDEHFKEGSGYCENTPRQYAEFDRILTLSTAEFKALVNHHRRARYTI